jgi:hypothetical protein
MHTTRIYFTFIYIHATNVLNKCFDTYWHIFNVLKESDRGLTLNTAGIFLDFICCLYSEVISTGPISSLITGEQ